MPKKHVLCVIKTKVLLSSWQSNENKQTKNNNSNSNKNHDSNQNPGSTSHWVSFRSKALPPNKEWEWTQDSENKHEFSFLPKFVIFSLLFFFFSPFFFFFFMKMFLNFSMFCTLVYYWFAYYWFSYVLYACILLICIIMGICELYVCLFLSCKALWDSKSAL